MELESLQENEAWVIARVILSSSDKLFKIGERCRIMYEYGPKIEATHGAWG